MEKRLRIFAGPNGSGKTTVIQQLKAVKKSEWFGVYVNADDIEKELRKTKTLCLEPFKIQPSNEELQHFFRQSEFSPKKLDSPDLWKKVQISGRTISLDLSEAEINSYIAADIAEFIRQRLLAESRDFCFETVMSHSNKLRIMEQAKNSGYRVYLYYVATNSPLINISRVAIRVKQKGHNVEKSRIKKRYYASLSNLKGAVLLSDRAYLFDNSGTASKMVAKINSGENVELVNPESTPNWIREYLFLE